MLNNVKIVAAATIQFIFVADLKNKPDIQPPNIQDTIVPWISKTGKLIDLYMASKLQEHQINLTSKQWILLRILSLNDGSVQNDLALITDRDKASLTRLINTMEKKNLVARIPDVDDKRINHIFLTKKGRKDYESTLPTVIKALAEIQHGISKEEINSMVKILQKVQHNIEKQINSCITN